MNTYVILLRGINVGGRNKLLMNDFVTLLKKLGCQNIKTYIQSGNGVFQTKNKNISKLAQKISQEINHQNNFKPQVLILTSKDFLQAINANPFVEADPKTLHLGFLKSTPNNPDLDKLDSLKTSSEGFKLINKVFYLHAPDGIGRSKLAAQTEKSLTVSMTSRNWRTVSKINELINELK